MVSLISGLASRVQDYYHSKSPSKTALVGIGSALAVKGIGLLTGDQDLDEIANHVAPAFGSFAAMRYAEARDHIEAARLSTVALALFIEKEAYAFAVIPKDLLPEDPLRALTFLTFYGSARFSRRIMKFEYSLLKRMGLPSFQEEYK